MALQICCACADKRPEALEYSLYVDGIGVTMRRKRWQNYCPECNVYWTKQKRRGNVLNSLMHVSEEDIVLTFKAERTRAVERIVPSNLTAASLKENMAEPLSCNPSELVLEAESIELMDSHMLGQDLFLGTTIRIYCGKVEGVVESDYDMMDDVKYIEKEYERYEDPHRKRPRYD